MSDQISNLELPASIAFNAGETKVFYLSGSYFELIDCPNTVDVILSDRNGGVRARMIGAAQTHHVKNTPYQIVQITSAAAQTIRFAYGSGEAGTRNTAGSVTLLNAVALDAATLAALESIDLNLATINALRRAEGHTGFSNASGALAVNTPERVFSPAANVNGATLLAAQISDFPGASISAPTLLAKNAAPATILDGAAYLRANLVDSSAGGSLIVEGSVFEKQYVPAGLGLYWISDLALTAAARRWTRYILH